MHKPATLMVAALFFGAAPVHVQWSAPMPRLLVHDALAKSGSNGKGNTNTGHGRHGGSSGNKRNGESKPGSGGFSGRAGGPSASSPDAVVEKHVGRDSVLVRYRNGYREQIYKDRFIMKDARGRTVISRRATPVDRIRLWLKEVGS